MTKKIYRVVVVVDHTLTLWTVVLSASVTSRLNCGSVPPQMYRRMRHVGNGPNDNGLVRNQPLTSTPRREVHEPLSLRLIRGACSFYRLPGLSGSIYHRCYRVIMIYLFHVGSISSRMRYGVITAIYYHPEKHFTYAWLSCSQSVILDHVVANNSEKNVQVESSLHHITS